MGNSAADGERVLNTCQNEMREAVMRRLQHTTHERYEGGIGMDERIDKGTEEPAPTPRLASIISGINHDVAFPPARNLRPRHTPSTG